MDKRPIQTGDVVRVKHWPHKGSFLAVIDDKRKGLIGGADWWPDAWWDLKHIERIFPNEDAPADWCQFEWNPELLPL